MPILADLFAKLIPLLEARTIICPESCLGFKQNVQHNHPDPAFALLLAVVREKRNHHPKCAANDAEGHLLRPIRAEEYHSRAAFWEQVNNGALEGALGKAFTATMDLLHPGDGAWSLAELKVSAMLEELVVQGRGDTRIRATQAIIEWMEAMA